jgi:hypothetical protein
VSWARHFSLPTPAALRHHHKYTKQRVYLMGTNEDGNDEIELLRNAVIAIVDMARKANSDTVKLAMVVVRLG